MKGDVCTRVGRVEVRYSDYGAKRVWVWKTATSTQMLPALLWQWAGGAAPVEVLPPWLASDPPLREKLPPPSETLLGLLRGFAEHRFLPPLIDALLEEYPQLTPYLDGVLADSAVATDSAESVADGVAATA